LKKTKKIKVLLTGGHARSTAYAVIQELQSKHKNWDLYWIGPKRVVEGKSSGSYDKEVFPKLGVHYLTTITGRLQRKFSRWTIPALLKIPFGFIQTFAYVYRIKPEITLSFGGFTAYPVVLASWLLKIPVVIHEQTFATGRANKYSAFFATKIAVARQESISYFPKEKCVVTGNPVSKEVRAIDIKQKISKIPRILITGGASGSETINNVTSLTLEQLLENYIVSHQTGRIQFKKFSSIKLNLSSKYKDRYHVYSVVPGWKMSKLINEADIIVSRAGANTISELMIAKRPCILIPIPFSIYDEQRKNAYFAEKFGIAKVIEQKDLTPGKFIQEINKLRKSWEHYIKNVKNKPSPDLDAASNVINLIESIL